MLTLAPAIQDLIDGDQIDGLYWLGEIELESGTVRFADSKDITWDGHTWSAFLDPEGPVGDVQQSLSLDEKNDSALKLCNINGAISALIRSNDVENRTCRIYLYFEEAEDAVLMFRGVCGKPDGLKEGVVEIPVIPMLHGPRVKLPGEKFTTICRFASYFADGKNCLYDPANGYGVVDPGTGLPFPSCPGTRQACWSRGMMAVNKLAPWDLSGQPLPWCNYAGFMKFTGIDTGSYKSGFLGLGRTYYTSYSTWSDNFLGAAIPLVYGKTRTHGIDFYAIDENSWLLAGAVFGEGVVMGAEGDEIWCNGNVGAPLEPWFTAGWIGQRRPEGLPTSDTWGPTPDAFCGTAWVLIRIPDEVGIQSGRTANIEAIVTGRCIRTFWYEDDEWHWYDVAWSENPLEVLADMVCNKRGGLRFGYDVLRVELMEHKAWADEEIEDVDGVTRKRYTCNGAILDSQQAGEVLERFRKEFGLYFRLYDDKLDWGFLKPDMTSVMTFSHALFNIVVNEDGSSTVEVTEKGAEDVPNRLYVSFLDADNFYEKTTFHLESAEQLAKAGKVIDENVFLGWTTNIGQALRIASNLFEKMIGGNYAVKWTSPLSALPVEVGDVVTVVSDHIPGGSHDFLVTSKKLTSEFDLEFEAEIYEGTFYDDVVADEYSDFQREPADNPLRLPDNVTDLDAAESPQILDGRRYSRITVTYTRPADLIWHHGETWWRDTVADPEDSWHYADTSTGGTSIFSILCDTGRTIAIRLVSVSRYGVRRDPRSADNPTINLLVTGTTDQDVPDAPLNLDVKGHSDDPAVPVGTYRVAFDEGADNWESVTLLKIECNPTLPFSEVPGENLQHWEFQVDPGNPANNGHFSYDLQQIDGALYFRVCAVNAFGPGPWAQTTETASSHADAGVPGAPGDVSASVNGNVIAIRWSRPVTNAEGITRYLVKYGALYTEVGGIYSISPAETVVVPPEETSCNVAVGSEGWYAVGVQAENVFGVGLLAVLMEED